LKLLENELLNLANNYDKSQQEVKELNKELDKTRYELDQIEKSDISHKERVRIFPENSISSTIDTRILANSID